MGAAGAAVLPTLKLRGERGQHCALVRMLLYAYRLWYLDQIQNKLKLSIILCNSKFSDLFQSSRRRNIQVMPFVDKNTVIFGNIYPLSYAGVA